jgi:hypothetical protein
VFNEISIAISTFSHASRQARAAHGRTTKVKGLANALVPSERGLQEPKPVKAICDKFQLSELIESIVRFESRVEPELHIFLINTPD